MKSTLATRGLSLELFCRAFASAALAFFWVKVGPTPSLELWTPPLQLAWLWLACFPYALAQLVFRSQWRRSADLDNVLDVVGTVEARRSVQVLWWVQHLLAPSAWFVFFFATEQNITYGQWNGLYLARGAAPYVLSMVAFASVVFYGFQSWAALLGFAKALLWAVFWVSKRKPRPRTVVVVQVFAASLYFALLGLLVSQRF